MKAMRSGRSFLFRLPKGSDIGIEVAAACRRAKVRCAWVQAIGATVKARLGYYDQRRRRYSEKEFRGEMEILHCSGNVSFKDGVPFAHLHAALADAKYRVWGGHLFASEVFAAEVWLQELRGPAPVRLSDPKTGLALWRLPAGRPRR
ncbi:MAG: DUF296 domain-containing protein [Elusimicrobiota bacterium]|jgi:hypothetical protein